MDFFNRNSDNHNKLMDAAPDIFFSNRRTFTHREPIVIKPTEIHKLLQLPRSLFKNILYYRGNFYVPPLNEPTYKFVGLTSSSCRRHPDWISMPVCVRQNPSKNKRIRDFCIRFADLPDFKPRFPRLEILSFYQLTTLETEYIKDLLWW